MTPTVTLVLCLVIGFAAGLRSLTAPAVVALAAHLGWINLHNSPLAFMGSTVAVVIFVALALFEYYLDQLARTPARTAPVGLSARVVTGALCGACLAVAGGAAIWFGAAAGAIGGIAGAFAGYHARTGLVRALRVPDIAVAIPEDLLAIGIGLLCVSRF
jgi:uncharacterized membrane protein